jgi:hypothetical protein
LIDWKQFGPIESWKSHGKISDMRVDPMNEDDAADLPMPTGSVLRHDGRHYYVVYLSPLSDPWSLMAHACKMAANGRVSVEFVDRLESLINGELAQ